MIESDDEHLCAATATSRFQRAIAQAMLAGASLEWIEEEIIDRCLPDDEPRAALGPYAEALQGRHSEPAPEDRALT